MRPLIDPREQIERGLSEREGIITPRALRDRLDEVERRDRAPRYLTCETLSFYRGNIGGSGDAAYLMRVGFPDTDASWAMGNLPLDLPAAGRILVVRIWASTDVTAGTIVPRARIIEGSDTTEYDFSGCELSTTTPRRKSDRFDWDVAVQVAKDATIDMRAVTAGSMTPTTIDVSMAVTIGYEEFD